MLVLSATCGLRRERFRLVVFLVKMWLPWDFENLYFPEPVFLNLFAAARFVLIFGIPFSPLNKIDGVNRRYEDVHASSGGAPAPPDIHTYILSLC